MGQPLVPPLRLGYAWDKDSTGVEYRRGMRKMGVIKRRELCTDVCESDYWTTIRGKPKKYA
jgi:hypothetical protein